MSGFGTGYDESKRATYADLAKQVKEMEVRDVPPSAYEDVLTMMEAMQEFLVGERDRLTKLQAELQTREQAVADTERRLALEKRALATITRSREATLTHEPRRQDKRAFGGGLWGRRSTTTQG